MMEVVLADGRVLGVEAVTPAESMRLAEGTRELSGNRGWCSLAVVVASVRSIDGIPRPFPTHKKHIEALLKDMDDADVARIRGARDGTQVAPMQIEFKKLSPYELLKIYEFAGVYNDVRGWMGPAAVAASVRKIDGKAIEFPESQGDVMALVDALGIAGIAAASAKMNEALDAAEAMAAALESAAKN